MNNGFFTSGEPDGSFLRCAINVTRKELTQAEQMEEDMYNPNGYDSEDDSYYDDEESNHYAINEDDSDEAEAKFKNKLQKAFTRKLMEMEGTMKKEEIQMQAERKERDFKKNMNAAAKIYDKILMFYQFDPFKEKYQPKEK